MMNIQLKQQSINSKFNKCTVNVQANIPFGLHLWQTVCRWVGSLPGGPGSLGCPLGVCRQMGSLPGSAGSLG